MAYKKVFRHAKTMNVWMYKMTNGTPEKSLDKDYVL